MSDGVALTAELLGLEDVQRQSAPAKDGRQAADASAARASNQDFIALSEPMPTKTKSRTEAVNKAP